MDVALVIHVVDASVQVSSDADAMQDTSCHLVAGTWRVATRPARRSSPKGRLGWGESFLLGAPQLEALTAGIAFELMASKRWGADALVAQALLGLEAFSVVSAEGQPVPLMLPLLAPKAVARAQQRGVAVPGGAGVTVEVGRLRLELRLVPWLPPPLVAPVAADASVPATGASAAEPGGAAAGDRPVVAMSADLLASCPVVHTPAGEAYEVAPVQVLRLLLRRCQGLHALHLEPAGAAPNSSSGANAAAVIAGGSRLAWSMSGRSARGSSAGGGDAAAASREALRASSTALFNRTGQWLKRASTTTRSQRGASALGAHAAEASPLLATGMELANLGTPAAVPAPGSYDDGLAESSEPPIPVAREPAASSEPAGADAVDSGGVAAGSCDPGDSVTTADDAPAAEAATPTAPHTRKASVDYGSVMNALEDLGFHTTDAPGGTWFYVKLSLDGWEAVSRMAPLSPNAAGSAQWDDAFCVALRRPAPSSATLVLELFASPDKKQRGRPVCRVGEPLWRVLDALTPQHVLDGAPLLLSASLRLLGSLPRHTCTFELQAELADADARAEARALPRHLAPPVPEAQGAGAIRSVEGTSAARQPPASVPAAAGAGGVASTPLGSSPPWSDAATLGALDVVVDGFTLPKPADCFFVLQLGPYWAVSSTSHSSAAPQWGWHLRVAVTDPAEVLSLALFRRDDQSGGKKVVMSLTRMFGEGVTLLAKLRVRLSTLGPNMPLSLALPMAADRTNTRSGQVGAAVARLRLHLHVPRLLGRWLPAYVHTLAPLQLLLLSRAGDAGSAPEAIDAAVMRTTCRWLEEQSPGLPPRVARRVVDNGRQEFTLSRTRHNWRRVLALRGAVEPAAALFARVVSWREPLLSGAVVSAIMLGGLFPGPALALALLWAATHIVRVRRGAYGAMWALPPQMEGDIAAPEDPAVGVPPTDPYSALKANYESVLEFTTAVQNVLDGWAASGERLQALLMWTDPVASSAFAALLALGALALLVVGLRGVVTLGLLWLVRPPPLRDPFPPPPANFLARLPTRRDVCL